MRAEFFWPQEPGKIVATAVWDGREARIDTEHGSVRGMLVRVFRPVPVAVDDPSRRALGTSGDVVAEPGDLDWFLAAAQVRGEKEGLAVRFASDHPGGWDPAGAYRRMGDWVGEREAGAAQPD